MKKSFLVLVAACFLLSSCYTTMHTVGSGAQGSAKTTATQWYLIGGLIPLATTDSKDLAGDAKNYTVKTQMTFIDGLISGLLGNIVTRQTVEVTK